MKPQNSMRHILWMSCLLVLMATGWGKPAVAKEPSTQAVVMTPATTLPDLKDTAATTAATTPAGASSDLSDLSLEDLMNVQVTSVSKKKESIADAPAAVTVIDQDVIARSGFSTIPDLLRLVPGMDVARINSYTWAVSSRGLNDQFGDKLLVLQDGRSVYSPIDAGVMWNHVDYVLQDLDRIEVIRGPGATLWGSNAVNGVINITSKDARDTQGWLVSGLGSNDDSNAVIRYGGKISDDTFYRVYFKGRYDQGLPQGTVSPSSTDQADYWRSELGGFRIDKHPTGDDSFTLQGDLGGGQIHTPTPVPVAAPPFTQSEAFNGSYTSGNVLGRWNHRVDDHSDFSLQLYYDYLQDDQGVGAFDQNTVDIDLHDRFAVGDRNEVTWGAGYRVYQTHAPTVQDTSWTPSSQVRNLFNLFVQDKIAIAPDRLFLTIGSKLEHNDFTGFEFEPGARLMWTPDKRNSFWGAVSRATRSPSSADTAANSTIANFEVPNGQGGMLPGRATVSGTPSFDSEKLIAYEAGYRVQATKSISLDLSAYYNNYTHLQSLSTGATQMGSSGVLIPSYFTNGAHGDTYGGEISANVQVTEKWRLAASYSLLHATIEENTKGPLDPIVNGDEGSAPRNQAQLHSYLDITKQLHFNASVYFTDSVAEFGVPAYVSTNLNVMWEPRDGMEVTLGVMNLIDNQHPEYGISGNQGYSDQVPRTVYATVSYRF